MLILADLGHDPKHWPSEAATAAGQGEDRRSVHNAVSIFAEILIRGRQQVMCQWAPDIDTILIRGCKTTMFFDGTIEHRYVLIRIDTILIRV